MLRTRVLLTMPLNWNDCTLVGIPMMTTSVANHMNSGSDSDSDSGPADNGPKMVEGVVVVAIVRNLNRPVAEHPLQFPVRTAKGPKTIDAVLAKRIYLAPPIATAIDVGVDVETVIVIVIVIAPVVGGV